MLERLVGKDFLKKISERFSRAKTTQKKNGEVSEGSQRFIETGPCVYRMNEELLKKIGIYTGSQDPKKNKTEDGYTKGNSAK